MVMTIRAWVCWIVCGLMFWTGFFVGIWYESRLISKRLDGVLIILKRSKDNDA